MGDVINLNRARKQRARCARTEQAEQNRLRHGRARHERMRDQFEAEKSARDLDALRLALPSEPKLALPAPKPECEEP
jgi:hypothetical protein